MFKFTSPLELPPQLQWKFAHEPELLGWTIRARNYNTFVANCMFGFLSIVMMVYTYALHPAHSTPEDELFNAIRSAGFFVMMCTIVSLMTHQKMNYAYRFTESSVEYCEWKDLPRWALPLLKWLAAITAVVFTFLATLDPTLIIGALIGPGGMALMYIRMAYSKSYRAIHTEYHHYFIRWCELTQATIATNRDMVELAYSIPKVNALYPTRGSQYVFYTRKDKPTVIDMLKRYLLDGTPCITDHIEVLN